MSRERRAASLPAAPSSGAADVREPAEFRTGAMPTTIAVIDDDRGQAEVVEDIVLDAGLSAVVLSHRFMSVQRLVEEVRDVAGAAICDHRLAPNGMADFTGAEAVSHLFAAGFPAVLLTQFAETDSDVTIRRWRDRVPVVLSREEASPESLVEGILYCQGELDGRVAVERIAQPSILEIVGTTEEMGEAVLDVIVHNWRPGHAVRLPLTMVGDVALQQAVLRDGWMLADVNIDADRADDLYFRGFARAPQPVRLDLPGAPRAGVRPR